jgi:hypothetical protein
MNKYASALGSVCAALVSHFLLLMWNWVRKLLILHVAVAGALAISLSPPS